MFFKVSHRWPCVKLVRPSTSQNKGIKNKNVGGRNVKVDDPIEIDLTNTSTIPISIGVDTVTCLIDTGATINLISDQYLEANQLLRKIPKSDSKIVSAKVADGGKLVITGCVHVPIVIAGKPFTVPFHVAQGLSCNVILGVQFLNAQNVTIDFGRSKLKIHRKNQLRIIKQVDIPARSQTVFYARVKNFVPPGIIGQCNTGRNVQSLGVLIANTISVTQTSKSGSNVIVLAMNLSDNPVTLYPRTKIGTFHIVDSSDITDLTNFDNSLEECEIKIENCFECDGSSDEILKKVDIEASLSQDQNGQLSSLFNEYSDIFQTKDSKPGFYDKVRHGINTGNNPPVRSRPYRHSPLLQQTIREHVKKMLKDGVISESTSPFASPIVMVKKKSGDYRFCVDFRALNRITERDTFPLPNITDTFDHLDMQRPLFFSTLDMASGYWQIALEDDAKKKTAFITQDGLFEFNVMPFGLHNAPCTFQRTMQEVLRGLHWKICLVYLDDIIVYSHSFADHLKHLRQVFDKFREANLKLKPKKCAFAKDKIKYLGHIVSSDGIATDPDKIKVVREYPKPKTVSEVRSFLGFTGYYRRYIKDCSKIAHPLTALTRKNAKFVWSQECDEAFQLLKQHLVEPPILAFPLMVQILFCKLMQVLKDLVLFCHRYRMPKNV